MQDEKSTLVDYAKSARKMWAAVVLAAIDDAIDTERKYGGGPEQIRGWASSRDGREVISNAGIDPDGRVIAALVSYVERGVKTTGMTQPQKKSTA